MSEKSSGVSIIPIKAKEVLDGDNTGSQTLGQYLMDCLEAQGLTLQDKDILVITSKIVSFFEDRIVDLDEVKPSTRARILGRVFGKEASKVELILREGKISLVVPFKNIARSSAFKEKLVKLSANHEGCEEVIKRLNSVFVVKKHGTQLDEGGMDVSNIPGRRVALLPEDPCKSADVIRQEIKTLTGKDVAVIITDTSTVLGRMGSLDTTMGYSGIDPITRKYGNRDLFGVPRSGGTDLVSDALSGIAGLVMGQTDERQPACLIKNYDYEPQQEENSMEILAYPQGLYLRTLVLVFFNTLLLYILNFFMLPLKLVERKKA